MVLRSFIPKILVLACIACPCLLCAQTVRIRFDYSQADLILEALTNPKIITPQYIEKLTTHYSTPMLMARAKRRNKNVDIDTLVHDLRVIAEGRKLPRADYFSLMIVKRDLNKHIELMKRVKQREGEITKELTDRFSKFMANGTLDVTVRFISIGASFGFAPDNSNFCIGIHWFEGDMTGMKWVMTHELFHNVQASGYTNSQIDSVNKRLDRNEQLFYEYLVSIYKEGTATFIADVEDFTSRYTAQHLERQQKGMRIITDHFLLMETILFRLYHEKDFSNANLTENIGSSWDWGNPCYYIGYKMCRILVRYNGPGYLRSILDKNPTTFVLDYLDITNKNKDDKDIVPVSSAIQDMILKIAAKSSAGN